jgi:hypothetical protein
LGKWFELLKRGEGDVSSIRYERLLQFEFAKKCFQNKHLKGSRDVHISILFSGIHVTLPFPLQTTSWAGSCVAGRRPKLNISEEVEKIEKVSHFKYGFWHVVHLGFSSR